MSGPWLPVEALDGARFADLRRRAIFDCCKWDPQVGDACVIAPSPLVICGAAWRDVARRAEALAAETLAAEQELARRPDLHGLLGLPRPVRRALREIEIAGPPHAAPRLMRFDFHYTSDGWRISEVNCDVPGGLNESSGLPLAIGAHYPWAAPVGDPARAYADALAGAIAPGGHSALVHATAYSDDRQMMQFLAAHLQERGVVPHLVSPQHLRWDERRARLETSWWSGDIDLVVRFFPAEWLPALPPAVGWTHFFAGARTPVSNPATAVLTQSKRFPLVWNALRTPLPTWRALLPETRDPRSVRWRDCPEWVVKPALGRVGEGVGIRGCVPAQEMSRIERLARWYPRLWVAQRRFDVVPVRMGSGHVYPCLGVYTLDGRAIGAYGRVAPIPLIDGRAADAGVLAA